MAMDEKELYINFDEYIRQGEPAQRERADSWRVAIGLQAVDGLKTSEYLQDTARRNIEGEITVDEARELVKQYYVSKITTQQHPTRNYRICGSHCRRCTYRIFHTWKTR